MSEKEKMVLNEFEKALKEHRLDDFKLGQVYQMAQDKAEGQECRQ